jgi:nucleotide-binding universal stress UspA family protein
MSTKTSIRSILVAHDFSETADRALQLALDLAERLGARVTIVHAYEAVYGFPESVQLTADILAAAQKTATKALGDLVARTERSGVEIKSSLRQGAAWKEINAAAKDLGADLIVIGTHGRHGIARALIGSVAEKVVRTAPCPVLTVHGPEASR